MLMRAGRTEEALEELRIGAREGEVEAVEALKKAAAETGRSD